jgi:hypothetical protein
MIIKTGFVLYFSIFLCFLLVFLKPYSCIAQSKPVLGVQFRPIIPSELFNNSDEIFLKNGVQYSIKPQLGYNIGVVIRQRIYKGISLESGINYVKRVYDINLQDSSFTSNTRFRYISNEIPILGLIYIQLSERAFLNNSFGLSFDFFPSDIYTEGDSINQITKRKYWVLPALTANLGFEYRTKKSGFFYFGGSYHRMLATMAYSVITYKKPLKNETNVVPLAGHYFSLDFKYFFPLRAKDPEPMLY